MIVLGINGLVRDLETLKFRANSPAGRKIFRRAAGKVRDAVRKQTPKKSGLLRRAIISYASRRRGAKADAAAFARVNILSGRVKAPHGHLVEFGTKDRRPKRGKYLVFYSRRYGWTRARMVRGMKPNPFFKRGVTAAGPQVLNEVVREMGDLLTSK